MPQKAWDKAADYLSEDPTRSAADVSLPIYFVLDWLHGNHLLRPSAQRWFDNRSDLAAQVGLFRNDVTKTGAAFLDRYYERWWNKSGILLHANPDEIAKGIARATLDDFWDSHTDTKQAKQRAKLRDLLENAGDWDLCDGVFVIVGDQYGHNIAANRYTAQERAVMLTWHASGIIDNGGFEYLFSDDLPGDPGYQLTVDAFAAIECDRAVSIFRDALALFPSSVVLDNVEERMKIYKFHPEHVREAINRRFWEIGWEHELERKLAGYIREHRSSFDWTQKNANY